MDDIEDIKQYLSIIIHALEERANTFGIYPTSIIIHYKLLELLESIQYD